MTDQEMLELAARAAGVEGEYMEYLLTSGEVGYEIRTSDEDTWNPLEDDGDAFRLGVDTGVLASGVFTKFVDMTIYQDDSYHAVRRAIVRAAAEIGKAMS